MLSLPLLVLLTVLVHVKSHSWMTCPPSFVATTGRGGFRGGLCENKHGIGAYVTEVEAGDRLKVGWTSNNHAGGYVRISLVSAQDDFSSEEVAKKHIMKYACYGHDHEAPTQSQRGDCNHPCGARGGCEYQSHTLDNERYDTTIGIPTNLRDGEYILQVALIVGQDPLPYYSCAKLYIYGGNPNPSFCKPPIGEQPVRYTCLESNKQATLENANLVGERGPFCYHLNGTAGTVDDDIRHVPINVECDPRMSCSAAIHSSECNTKKGMDVVTKQTEAHRTQPYCYVYNTVPPLPPTCDDGIHNQDEESVDCGGEKCEKCPPPIPETDPYVEEFTENVGTPWATGAVINYEIKLKQNISSSTCWQLRVQFACPMMLLGNAWNQGRQINTESLSNNFLAFESLQRTFFEGSTVRVSFQVQNPCAAGYKDVDEMTNDGKCDTFCKEWSALDHRSVDEILKTPQYTTLTNSGTIKAAIGEIGRICETGFGSNVQALRESESIDDNSF